MGKKICPLCRNENYEKRQIFDGAKGYRSECAKRIQSVWRGFQCRQLFFDKLLAMKKEPQSKGLKTRLLEEKLRRLNKNLSMAYLDESGNIDDFLSSMDDAIQASRSITQVFKLFKNTYKYVMTS